MNIYCTYLLYLLYYRYIYYLLYRRGERVGGGQQPGHGGGHAGARAGARAGDGPRHGRVLPRGQVERRYICVDISTDIYTISTGA